MKPVQHLTAGLELAAAIGTLPSSFRQEGLIQSINYAFRLGFSSGLWSKAQAVHLAFKANMERGVGVGHGNKAAKREAYVTAPPEWFDDTRLTIRDVDALAEFWGESRTFRRTRLNFHE